MGRVPRWVIRLRLRRFWRLMGRTVRRISRCGWGRSNRIWVTLGGGGGGRGDQDGAGHASWGDAARRCMWMRPSPHVDWSAGAVSLLTEARPWPADGRPRRAGVSSFGISGTNAHVILEQAPTDARFWWGWFWWSGLSVVPWVVSAKSVEALAGQAARLLAHVEADEQLDVVDVGVSLARRSVFEHRAVVVGADREQLLAGLAEVAAGQPGAGAVMGRAQSVGKTVMVFPGQGSQWLGMGRAVVGRFTGVR